MCGVFSLVNFIYLRWFNTFGYIRVYILGACVCVLLSVTWFLSCFSVNLIKILLLLHRILMHPDNIADLTSKAEGQLLYGDIIVLEIPASPFPEFITALVKGNLRGNFYLENECMYECLHDLIIGCEYISIYVCLSLSMYVCMYISVYVCMYVCMYVCLFVYVCSDIYCMCLYYWYRIWYEPPMDPR